MEEWTVRKWGITAGSHYGCLGCYTKGTRRLILLIIYNICVRPRAPRCPRPVVPALDTLFFVCQPQYFKRHPAHPAIRRV